MKSIIKDSKIDKSFFLGIPKLRNHEGLVSSRILVLNMKTNVSGESKLKV